MAAPAASLTCHPEPFDSASTSSASLRTSSVEAARREAFEALKARLSAPAKLPRCRSKASFRAPSRSWTSCSAAVFRTAPSQRSKERPAVGAWRPGSWPAMTRRSLVAILDDGTLYPPALAEAGARLERVFVVPARKALQIARAVDILLRSRICRLVLMPAVALRDAVWTRLAKLAHRSGVLLLVMAARAGAALSAAAELRLHCALERIVMHGTHGLWGSFAGFELCVDLRKHKHLAAGRTAHLRVGREEMRDAALR